MTLHFKLRLRIEKVLQFDCSHLDRYVLHTIREKEVRYLLLAAVVMASFALMLGTSYLHCTARPFASISILVCFSFIRPSSPLLLCHSH